MNRSFRLFFSICLLFLLIIVIHQAVRTEDLKQVLWNFPKEQLLLFIGLSVAISFIKSFRFLMLLHNNKIPISLWQTSRLYFASQTTTPLPGGETLRGILISHHTKTPITKTAGPIISQAFLEIGSAIFLVFIGSLFIEDDLLAPAITLFILLSIISFLILHQKTFNSIITKFPDLKFLNKLRIKLKTIQKGIAANVFDPHHSLLKTFTISIAIHLLGGLLIFAIAKAYDVDINFFTALFVYTAGIIIQGLGFVIPASIGITESGMTGVLLLSNVDLAKAIAIVLLFRIVTLIFGVLIGLAFFLIFYFRNFLLSGKTLNI